jgi:hypothetical protein
VRRVMIVICPRTHAPKPSKWRSVTAL